MLSPIERRGLDAIDDDETVELLQGLIRRPSENPPGAEAATAGYLAEYLERAGVSCRLDEIEPGRPNLIAELGPGGGPTLVLNGHTDTVPAGDGWTVDPFSAPLTDGRIYGRGACDMLAGVAAMSSAMAALKRSGVRLGGLLVVHAVIDEEVVSKGSRKACGYENADWVIVTEPSASRIEAYGKGQLNVEITFQGLAAHSSTPEVGRNAIHDAAAFITRLEQANREASSNPFPGVGPATYTAAIVAGGSNGSIVPASCVLTVDRRVLPNETLEQAQEDIQRLLDETAAERPGLQTILRSTLLFPPLPPAGESQLTQTIASALSDLGVSQGEISGSTGATDASWYAARGIPAVICGPGNGGTAHQPDEFVEISDVLSGTRVLLLSALRLIGVSE